MHNLELLLNRHRHGCLSLEESTRSIEEMLLPTSDCWYFIIKSLRITHNGVEISRMKIKFLTLFLTH